MKAKILLFPNEQSEDALAIAEERRDRIDGVMRDIEAIMQSLYGVTHGDAPRARFWLLGQLDMQHEALKLLLGGEEIG